MSFADEFEAELRAEAAEALAKLARGYEEIQQTALARVKELTRVDTGALRDSWRIEGGGAGFQDAAIVSDLEYASFVEDGTRTTEPGAMVALTFAELKTAIIDTE